jgi:hypothetical protein
MKRPGKEDARGVWTPTSETTSFELSSSAPAAKGIASTDTLSEARASQTAIMAVRETEPDNPPTLASPTSFADAHRDATRSFGLVLATPGVPEALRAAGRWDGARRSLYRHMDLARARGEA